MNDRYAKRSKWILTEALLSRHDKVIEFKKKDKK
jgi:hypothetical protein